MSSYLERYGLGPGFRLLVASVPEIIRSNAFLSIRCLVSYVIVKALGK